jgi:7,8-dihydro-6-hydroxymethylpterin dimethyltransferase
MRPHQTTSLCRVCKRSVAATITERDGEIWMEKRCPEHGPQEVMISADARWYHQVMAFAPQLEPPREVKKEVAQGCPFDCGACRRHEQRVLLPIVPITSACDLACPICYTHNKNEGAFHMSEAELGKILESLRKVAPERRMINITGGEPTQHPDLIPLLRRCREEGIHRVTLSTHGLRFLKDEAMVEALAALDVRVILSFDSFEGETNKAMLGGNFLKGKLKVLDVLERHGVSTTLLPVLAKHYNDHEVGQFVELALGRDFIRSVELHTMTFTGQLGVLFNRKGRYGTVDVLRDIEQQTQGALRVSDFVPAPGAHPLCYLVAYVMRVHDQWVPMTRLMPAQDVRDLLSGGLYMEPDQRTEEKLQDVINRLWAGDIACEHDPDLVLSALNDLIRRLFAPGLDPVERMRIAERSTKAIYIHSHMDEETFDTDRIRQCCVGIAGPDGENIPSCAYNVLYRERDPRFTKAPKPSIDSLGPGRVDQ